MNTTTDIIKIENRDGVETVDARELHNFLEVKRDFPTWINERINKYGFIKDLDFSTIMGKSSGGRMPLEFYISIDMAKELSMVENNQKGREARQYFILMEKKAKNMSMPELSEAEIVKQALLIQQRKIEMLSIKAQVADQIADTEGLYLPSLAGKMIAGHANIFCQWLVNNKIMFRRKDKLIPYAPYDKKYFDIKVSVFGNKSTSQSYFTTRGLMWAQALYFKKNNLLQLDYSENV